MELSCAANGPFVTWVYCSHRLEACGGSSSQHSAVAAISEIKTTTKAGPKAKGHNVAALRLWLCFRPNNGRISRSDAMRTLSFAGQLPGKKGDGAWAGAGYCKRYIPLGSANIHNNRVDTNAAPRHGNYFLCNPGFVRLAAIQNAFPIRRIRSLQRNLFNSASGTAHPPNCQRTDSPVIDRRLCNSFDVDSHWIPANCN